jgi:hypothetical protein
MKIRGTFMAISESAGRELLGPYQDYLAESIREGWKQYFIKYQNTLHEHTPGDRAALINTQMNIAVRSTFAGMSGTRLHGKPHRQFWLFIEELVGIRFKKLDRYYRSSWNHGTGQSRRFNHQLPPDYTWLNAEYVPNRLWSSIEAMYVVCPRNDIAYGWKIPLHDEPQIQIDFTPLIIPPLPPVIEPPTPSTGQRARWQLKEGEFPSKEQTNEPAS